MDVVAALARPRSRDYAITLTLHHPTPGGVVRIQRVERRGWGGETGATMLFEDLGGGAGMSS